MCDLVNPEHWVSARHVLLPFLSAVALCVFCRVFAKPFPACGQQQGLLPVAAGVQVELRRPYSSLVVSAYCIQTGREKVVLHFCVLGYALCCRQTRLRCCWDLALPGSAAELVWV